MKRKIDPQYLIHLLIWKNYYYLRPELMIIRKLVNPLKNSIDIGANRGIYTYFLSRYSKYVYAFEPHPDLFKFLSKSTKLNVSLFQLALSNVEKSSTLSVPIINGEENDGLGSLENNFEGAMVQNYTINTRCLDDYNLSNIGFLKIDVEGHEEKILQGAQKLLESQRPNLYIEIEQRHLKKDMSEIFSLLKQLNYDGFYSLDRELIPISQFNKDQHQDLLNFNTTLYINNFIFIPCL